MGFCKKCGKEFKDWGGLKRKKIFCCHLCRSNYNATLTRIRNRNNSKFIEYHKKKSKEWFLKNREKQNKNLLKDYRKNKYKWQSRKLTRKLLSDGIIFIEKKCKNGCDSKKFQIHHEEYSIKKQGIIKLVEEEKIYYLCLHCHNKSHLGVKYDKKK